MKKWVILLLGMMTIVGCSNGVGVAASGSNSGMSVGLGTGIRF